MLTSCGKKLLAFFMCRNSVDNYEKHHCRGYFAHLCLPILIVFINAHLTLFSYFNLIRGVRHQLLMDFKHTKQFLVIVN